MSQLLDKTIIFIVCLTFYIPDAHGLYVVVPVIASITASALNTYFDRNWVRVGILATMIVASLVDVQFVYFLPLLCFDLFGQRAAPAAALALIPLIFYGLSSVSYLFIQIALIILLVWFMKVRSQSLQRLKLESASVRDSARETLLQLESKNRELLERQDYEVNLATLNERNRIAREIHDNVGHLLTRAILVTGAMIASSHEEPTRQSLHTLKDTLTEGMDSIRTSLHDLHDQSIDLNAEVRALTDGFDFCPLKLEFDVEHSPDIKTKYAFLAIIREALANIIHHSQATSAVVVLREHPGFYQLIIRDNGIGAAKSKLSRNDEGIGLKSIAERVASLGGLLNISSTVGFVIFITVPKTDRMEQAQA